MAPAHPRVDPVLADPSLSGHRPGPRSFTLHRCSPPRGSATPRRGQTPPGCPRRWWVTATFSTGSWHVLPPLPSPTLGSRHALELREEFKSPAVSCRVLLPE